MKNNKNLVTGNFKVWVNEHGTHISTIMRKQSKVLTEEQALESDEFETAPIIAKVTYHVSTNSATVGSIIDKTWSQDDVLVWLADLIKCDWFQDYIKKSANLETFEFKPIWCKQTCKHYC